MEEKRKSILALAHFCLKEYWMDLNVAQTILIISVGNAEEHLTQQIIKLESRGTFWTNRSPMNASRSRKILSGWD